MGRHSIQREQWVASILLLALYTVMHFPYTEDENCMDDAHSA